MPPREPAVIEGKVRVPPPPQQLVRRERLEQLLATLTERHRVVVVSATAGAGKTTAVAETAPRLARPMAWLSVDRTDVAPGRLVTYLEAALVRQVPSVAGVATQALAAGIPHAEAAGLLADAVGDAPVVLVVDDLERLGEAPEPWAVIEAIVRYAADGMRVVLCSRREIPGTLCALPSGGAIAVVGESDLAFTVGEAGDALAAQGHVGADPAAAVEATGGWVTGVLFEAWRLAGHVAGAGGEADALNGYLSSHILGQLAPADRDFLVTTALLDEVTAARAEALGAADAGERLASLATARLPVSRRADGHVMRCHPRFREYLLERLERRSETEVRALRARHGRLLAAEGHYAEATEELLLANELQEALAAAEEAVPGVIERLDFPIAERWLRALGHLVRKASSPLVEAELMLALATDDYPRGLALADRLAKLGAAGRLTPSSEGAAPLLAWCYGAAGRFEEGLALLDLERGGPTVNAILYSFSLFGAAPPPPRPELTGSALDALVFWAHYLWGRLPEFAEPPESAWVEAVARPWRIAALRASGQTQLARELYENAQGTGVGTIFLRAVVGPEILIDAGLPDAARQELMRFREQARRSSPWYRLWNGLAEVKLVLRLERDPAAARRLLDLLELEPGAREALVVRDLIDTWYGLTLLQLSEDAAALDRLRSAVEGMVVTDRILDLPTAAVYLAEAEWRAGDDDAADDAAKVALEAAGRQGSNHLLLQALADFPAVASRCIDAEPRIDSPWHELGRALLAQGLGVDARPAASVELREFGSCEIVVDGAVVRPGITKSYELLAYLAAHPGVPADRAELLDALFDGRDDDSSRAYLRQAISRLRRVLAGHADVIVEDGRVRLGGDVVLRSESIEFETRLAEAARGQGAARLTATLDVLATYDRGDYLPGGRSRWVDERRGRLAELAVSARYEAAQLALSTGRYDQARALADEVLRVDPFREAAWRLVMRVANALGDEDGVISAFHGCERALATLDTKPSHATRELLESLRR